VSTTPRGEVLAYYRLHAPGVVEAFETDVRDAVAFIERHPPLSPHLK
jgi:hypothetical protein